MPLSIICDAELVRVMSPHNLVLCLLKIFYPPDVTFVYTKHGSQLTVQKTSHTHILLAVEQSCVPKWEQV
jgi:hypothetical protein